MASELDHIARLVADREFAAGRSRLDRLDPVSMDGSELGRYRALEIACLLGTDAGDAAAACLAAALGERGSDSEFVGAFGTTLCACDRCVDLEGPLRRLADSAGTRTSSAFVLGLVLVEDGQNEAALELLHQTLSQSADRVRYLIRCNIAKCHESLGDPEAAAHTYGELLRDQPDEHELWRSLARCQRLRGDAGAAAQAMQRYVEYEPDDASAWASLGDFRDDAGMPGDAEAAWQRAVELTPGDATIYYNWGVSAGRRKDLDRVRACAESLRGNDPDDPLALALDSILLESEGDTWRGWEAMRQAFDRECDRDRSLALAHRTLLYAERNELAEPAGSFIGELHTRNLLDEDVLEIINRIESRRSTRARDFSVRLDAVPNPQWCAPELLDAEGAPTVRHVRRLRVVADTSEEAHDLAVQFERRCGADDVRIAEVVDEGPLEDGDWPGVWWCPEVLDCYSAQEFE